MADKTADAAKIKRALDLAATYAVVAVRTGSNSHRRHALSHIRDALDMLDREAP